MAESGAGPGALDQLAGRPMRADAVKNRERILQAAEETFALEGVTVPIDAVAARAEVGVGTLYRHFPTKEALFEAVVAARLLRLLQAAKECSQGAEPGEALFLFLREFAKQASVKRDLFEALSSAGIELEAQCSGLLVELTAGIELLLQRAVALGAVRSDVPTAALLSLIAGSCHAAGQSGMDDASLQQMVEIVIDGLRPFSR